MANEKDFGVTSLGCKNNAGLGGNEGQGLGVARVRSEAPVAFTTDPFLSLSREVSMTHK